MILSRDEARDVIKEFLEEIATAPSEDEAHYDVETLLDKLYLMPDLDVVVLPLKKVEQIAGLLHQGTMKLLMHTDLATVEQVHNERDRQLSPYLGARELYFLKSALVHNAWTARWLVMNAKENPT